MKSFDKISCICAAALLTACSGTNKGNGQFDEGFQKLSDGDKVAYVMQNASPDSVARFIVNASIGRTPGVTIQSLPEATLYAYEHYSSEKDLQTFSNAYDEYAESLPLEGKMKIMKLAGTIDPNGIGYQLGLEYVSHIRNGEMSVDEVTEEIEAFRKACANDDKMFQRFITGFKVALEEDHGKDLKDDIYLKFKNYK